MDSRVAVIYGAPGESRTLDLFVRNEMLYPSELRAHWRHYRRFFMRQPRLVAFLFAIPYVLGATRLLALGCDKGHGWTLVETTAKTHRQQQARL